MNAAEQKALVRARYGGIAATANTAVSDCSTPPEAASACCGPTEAPGVNNPSLAEKALRMGYSDAELAAVPDGANLGLGCGNPQAIAALRARRDRARPRQRRRFRLLPRREAVGPDGPRDRRRHDPRHGQEGARQRRASIGAGNVEFRLGEIEHLPVADDTADVIISNCVINLSPDKARSSARPFAC